MTTRAEIIAWINRSRAKGATHMIVACDLFDMEDYPIHVMPGEDVRDRQSRCQDRVMEVYWVDPNVVTAADITSQLAMRRSFTYGPDDLTRPTTSTARNKSHSQTHTVSAEQLRECMATLGLSGIEQLFLTTTGGYALVTTNPANSDGRTRDCIGIVVDDQSEEIL